MLSSADNFPLTGLFAGGTWSGEPGAFLLALAEDVEPFMIERCGEALFSVEESVGWVGVREDGTVSDL